MSSYWVSEDWKVKVETLESYLRSAIKRGIRDFIVIATEDDSLNVQFAIHPLNAVGETIDYKVTGNSLYPADPAFEKPQHPIIQYSRTGNGRVHQMSTFTEYLSLLERLRQAADKKDQGGMESILSAMWEWDEEMGTVDEDEDEQCADCDDGVFTGRDDGGMYCETCGRRWRRE